MSRNTTTDVRSFSIYKLRAWGKLESECTNYGSIVWFRDGEEVSRIGYKISTLDGGSYIELDYRTRWHDDEEWRPIKYKIPLERVRCHFGGKRWFFKCPMYRLGNYCGRRVGKMYKTGDYFACRHCADLTYESCNEGKRFRGYPWNMLFNDDKLQEAWEKIGYTHYRGRPTKKYRRYLRLAREEDNIDALGTIKNELGRGKI